MIIKRALILASLCRLLFLAATLLAVSNGSIGVKIAITENGRNSTSQTQISYSSQSLKYKVVDGWNRTLFRGGDLAVFVNGVWCAAASSQPPHVPLVFSRKQVIQGKIGGLGRYRGMRIEWRCQTSIGSVPIVTSFKNFASKQAILFELDWPKGATNTSLSGADVDRKATLATFPSFVLTSFLALTPPSASEPRVISSSVSTFLPDALSWEGSFVQSVRGFSAGQTGGPTIFYNASDPSLTTVVVASPYSSRRRTGDTQNAPTTRTATWNTFTAGNNKDWTGTLGAFSPGTSGRISNIPLGFRQSQLLFHGSGGGITATLDEWGAAMQASQPSSLSIVKDVTLDKIGYQTDNGAMYCFCSSHNCSQILIEEKEYLDSIGIPIGYLSFQGAGTSSGRGTAAPWCVDTWGVDGGEDPNHYPLDVQTFQRALGVPLQLYAPYFCPNSTYFRGRRGIGAVDGIPGMEASWKSVTSNTALPSCSSFNFETVAAFDSETFFAWFLRKGAAAGMASFEADFMNQNVNCVDDFVQSATAADQWISGMADAALDLDIPIQWCYATPNEVMASLDFPAVTNFRVSFDFCYGHSYDIGESSLLVWAIGKAPSKDTLWTTDNGKTVIPGCSWTADHEPPAAELHVVLALMSTGPVGISDAIGMTNSTLLSRAITTDGTLLQPMKPVTAVDSTFLLDSKLKGYLYGTYGRGKSWIFVSFQLHEAYGVTLRDFWPRVPMNELLPDGRYPSLAYRAFSDPVTCRDGEDAIKSACIAFVTPTDDTDIVVAVPKADFSSPGTGFAPHILTVWQRCEESGWFFLGELDKYVTLSPRRFLTITCTQFGVSASIRGSLGEAITLTLLRPRRHISGETWYEVVQHETIIDEIDGMLLFEIGEPPLSESTAEV